MAILYKDFTTFRRINSIHIERLEDLKTFFDEIGVIYSEGQATLNWSNVLTEIRDNFEDWLDDGGWNFLIEDIEEGGEGVEGESGEDDLSDGSNASYGSDEDESDFSDEDSSDESVSDESEGSADELSEEG
jgi:nucleosome binding factor SPN SPT16 subunit